MSWGWGRGGKADNVQGAESAGKNTPVSELMQYFKVAISMSMELQDTMAEEVQEVVMTLHHKSINKGRETMEKNQVEMRMVKSMIKTWIGTYNLAGARIQKLNILQADRGFQAEEERGRKENGKMNRASKKSERSLSTPTYKGSARKTEK